jgi:hypothetical protein
MAHETYVVRERPIEVVYVRPPAPGPQHVWVSGDWVWESGGYHWHEGRWERRHEGVSWRDGHWKTTPHGYKWVPGRWG